MKRHEMLLVQLMEECDEVSKRCAKALRFGLEEVQANHEADNADRIVEELHDLIGTALLLENEGHLSAVIPPAEVVSARQGRVAEARQPLSHSAIK